MRFLADMGISVKTANHLRARGYDTVHLAEERLERLPDPQIMEKARAENRVLLVHDLGFGELLAASGSRLPSAIVFRLRRMRPDRVNHYLDAVLDRYADALQRGAIISVTEGQIRVRRLPIGE